MKSLLSGLILILLMAPFVQTLAQRKPAPKRSSVPPSRFDMKDAPKVENGKVADLINITEYSNFYYGKEIAELNKKIKELAPAEGEQSNEGQKNELAELNAQLAEIKNKAEADIKGRDEAVEAQAAEYRSNQSDPKALQKLRFLATNNINFVIDFEDKILADLKKKVDSQRAAFTKNREKMKPAQRAKALEGIEKAGVTYTQRSTKRNLIYSGRYRFVNAVVDGAKNAAPAKQ